MVVGVIVSESGDENSCRTSCENDHYCIPFPCSATFATFDRNTLTYTYTFAAALVRVSIIIINNNNNSNNHSTIINLQQHGERSDSVSDPEVTLLLVTDPVKNNLLVCLFPHNQRRNGKLARFVCLWLPKQCESHFKEGLRGGREGRKEGEVNFAAKRSKLRPQLFRVFVFITVKRDPCCPNVLQFQSFSLSFPRFTPVWI